MPIHLPVPTHRNGGPDGQGWNRVSLGSLAGDECALRPRDFTHLREAHQDTRRARYGGYGPCIASGACETCLIFKASPKRLDAFTDRVLVRVDRRGEPHLMNRPEDGWASMAQRWTWADLMRVTGWSIGRAYSDEHGDGFWLIRTPAP